MRRCNATVGIISHQQNPCFHGRNNPTFIILAWCLWQTHLRSWCCSMELFVVEQGKMYCCLLFPLLKKTSINMGDACQRSQYPVECRAVGSTLVSWVSGTHQNTLQFSWFIFWDEPFRKVDYTGSSLQLSPLLISSLPTFLFHFIF